MSNNKQHAQAVTDAHFGGDFEIWDLTKIQTFLNVSESTAKRLVLQEGFPAPIVNRERNRRWLAGAVLGYFLARSNEDEQRPTAPKLKTQRRDFHYITAKLVG